MNRTELCEWLRANSSGIYRPAADAAVEIEYLSAAYTNACKLVADMHAAAVGEIRSPTVGVVDDVAALRDDAELYRWLLANLNCSLTYEKRGNSTMRYRMRNNGDEWGKWHKSPRHAIDAAMAA